MNLSDCYLEEDLFPKIFTDYEERDYCRLWPNALCLVRRRSMIRRATIEDASRIAEISIFTKRMNYRAIFRNDKVSFGEMQVYPLADSYIHNPQLLQGIWVFDDEFVKGFINIEGKQITELYVDSFFEHQGIGGRLLSFAVTKGCNSLWVLEKNTDAQRFYSKHGFAKTGERKLEEGTDEYIIEMKR